jgi:hypothetical protein
LSDKHLLTTMQILYVQKLQSSGYQQHTYAIITINIHRYLTNCLQHAFINNNHWILVQIHASTLDLNTQYMIQIDQQQKNNQTTPSNY